MESSPSCSSVIRILLRHSEGPSPCPPASFEALEPKRREDTHELCCVYVCVAGRAGREAHKPESPSPQQKAVCRRVGRERGWEEGRDVELESGSEKIPCLLLTTETSWHIRSPSPQGPRATCTDSPGRSYGGSEVSGCEGLESLCAKGWMAGSEGERWAGQKPRFSTSQRPGTACGLEGQ